MGTPVNAMRALVVVAALLAPCAAQGAVTGKSFLDFTYAEEPLYSVPATFPGPLVPLPRRKPDARWMLLACVGLLAYLGRGRAKALAAS
jgi:hypothetical protein